MALQLSGSSTSGKNTAYGINIIQERDNLPEYFPVFSQIIIKLWMPRRGDSDKDVRKIILFLV